MLEIPPLGERPALGIRPHLVVLAQTFVSELILEGREPVWSSARDTQDGSSAQVASRETGHRLSESLERPCSGVLSIRISRPLSP